MFVAKLWRLWLVIRGAGVLSILSMCLFGAAAAGSAELIMLEEEGCGWCERWNEEVGVVYHKTVEGKRAPLRRLDIHELLPSELRFITKGGYAPTFYLWFRGAKFVEFGDILARISSGGCSVKCLGVCQRILRALQL